MNIKLWNYHIGICPQILIAVILMLLQPSLSWGCSKPVFRYAMESWYPDLYQAVLIHEGMLTSEDSLKLQMLVDKTVSRSGSLNLHIQEINLQEASKKEVKRLIHRSIPPQLPAIAIWYPGEKGHSAPIWTGSLSQFILDNWGDSPLCKQLSDHLIGGDSGVWLFLESGNSKKDSIAYNMLESSLNDITKEIKQFAQIQPDTVNAKFEYRFSILRISQKDPAERVLISLLVDSNPDSIQKLNEPMVCPVFGRGRLLFSLVGEEINDETINNAAVFITGPCGCEIKVLNPGVDLLIQADWEKAVFPDMAFDGSLPELTGIMTSLPNISSERIEPEPLNLEKSGSGFWMLVIGSIALLVLAVSIISFFILKSNKENT